MPAHSRQKATLRRMLPGGAEGTASRQKATVREQAEKLLDSHTGALRFSWSDGPGLQQSILPRACNGLRSIRRPQLGQDIGDMFSRGRQLDHELIGDFLIRGALCQELQDSLLLRGKWFGER